MARARNIKPAFFTSEQVADNCPLGRLLFIGLWTESDYQGNIEWKPRTLKVKLLPFDNCDIEQLAINLDKSGLIRFYSVAGQLFVNIPNFDRHQNPHKNERDKGTDIPAYSEEARQVVDLQGLTINLDKNGTNPEQNGSDRADSLFLLPDSLNLNPEGPTPEKKKKPAKPSAIACPHDVEQSTWDDWLLVRKAKRAPLTETALNEIVKEANKAGVTLDQALKTCVKRNWVGFDSTWSGAVQSRPTAHTGFAGKNYSEGIGDDGRIL